MSLGHLPIPVVRDHLGCLTLQVLQVMFQGEIVDIECIHQPELQRSSAIDLAVFWLEDGICNLLSDSESIQNLIICPGLPRVFMHLRDMTFNENKEIIWICIRMNAILAIAQDI